MQGVTQNDVRLALAKEDTADLQEDDTTPVHHKVSRSVFVASGLELEVEQYAYPLASLL